MERSILGAEDDLFEREQWVWWDTPVILFGLHGKPKHRMLRFLLAFHVERSRWQEEEGHGEEAGSMSGAQAAAS